jgi:tRNA(Arg) A34 adenosine deaminase TadA
MQLDDQYFMRKALEEAERAHEIDEVPVGAVIVVNQRIIARAHNLTERLNDVTAHAEMQAITSAANFLGGKVFKRMHPLCYSRTLCDVYGSFVLESVRSYCLCC